MNGKKASGNEMLFTGDTVKLFLSDDTISKFSQSRTTDEYLTGQKGRGTKLDILYEDRHTIFINKPAGMLSQKAAPGDVSLVEHLIAYLPGKRADHGRRAPYIPPLGMQTAWTGIQAASSRPGRPFRPSRSSVKCSGNGAFRNTISAL